MALIALRQLLDHAAEHGYGVPAFNVNNLEQIQAVMQAADECESPAILQVSAGARKYAGEAFLRHLLHAAAEDYPHIPIVLHQDHGASLAVCQRSIRADSSRTPWWRRGKSAGRVTSRSAAPDRRPASGPWASSDSPSSTQAGCCGPLLPSGSSWTR